MLTHRALAAAALLALTGVSAHAADQNSWSGCYAGANAGYGWSKYKMNRVDDGTKVGSTTADGAGYGLQAGCDWQRADWVFGGQASLNGASVKGDHLFANGSGPHDDVNYDLKAFGSLTARAGWLVSPKTLAYAKGGLAWSETKYKDSDPAPTVGVPYSGSNTKSQTGWLLGFGAEHRYSTNLSVFAEYTYADFGKRKVTIDTGNGDVDRYNFRQQSDFLGVGVNYRF